MHRDSQVRSYEDCAAGVWDGTGFVVSLENPKAGTGAWDVSVFSWVQGLSKGLLAVRLTSLRSVM